MLRTMNSDKLLKTLPVVQQQLDALVEFDCTAQVNILWTRSAAQWSKVLWSSRHLFDFRHLAKYGICIKFKICLAIEPLNVWKNLRG